jgi:type II secretion system protein L
LSDPEQAARFRQLLAARGSRCVFACPGAELRLLELAVTTEERRHISSSLPFMLEESLATDLEGQHFARMALDRQCYAVAIVDRALMQGWEESLGDFADALPWVPEPLLLPWEAGEWTLLVEEESALLRHGRSAGTRIELALLPALLEALLVEAPPSRVVIYGANEATDRARLPGSLEAPVEWRRGGLGAALLLSDAAQTPLNLRQGEFAAQLPYDRWWAQWRKIAAVLLVAVLAHLLSGWLDYRRLERENQVLRSEIQSVYREVNPRGAVVDAQKQLERQLAALGGADAGGSFTRMLSPLAGQLAGRSDTVLASLNYSQRNAELRVNLLAPDFAEVEALRAALLEAGFDASLESSSRSGDRVRARLRIGGGS